VATFRKELPVERQPINKLPDLVFVMFCLPDTKVPYSECIDMIEVKDKFSGDPFRESLFFLHHFKIFLDSSMA